MDDIDATSANNKIKGLTPFDQEIIFGSSNSKEETFLKDSEKHLKDLRFANSKIDEIIGKFEQPK